MTLSDARKILGLDPDADPRPHLAEFKNAREHIAAMVLAAPNEILAGRYRKGLTEFDEALAAVEALLAEPPQVVEKPAVIVPSPPKTIFIGVTPAAPKPAAAETAPTAQVEREEKSGSRVLSYITCFLLVFLVAAGGGWFYLEHEGGGKAGQLLRISELERQGAMLVENRRWQEASANFAEIEKISPGSEIASRGRRSIEIGKTDEETQFIGYWNGQATAELEAGRLDEAEAAARQVLAKYPGEKEASALLEKIAAARAGSSHASTIAAAHTALDQRNFTLAAEAAQKILTAIPEDPEATAILADATAGIEKSAADRVKAAELLKNALARDNSQFDEMALDWVREAKSLDPGNTEIAALFEKLSAYTRTLHVPGDFDTPAAALENARDRDRIVLGPGTWAGPLVVDAAVELQGTGFAETKVECGPEEGSVITIGPDAKGARVSGISFRHKSFAAGTDRFSVALVRGGVANFTDCHFTEASGHGLAVMEAGQATVTCSRFEGNGWDGAAAFGKGTTLEMRECEALNNFEHGIESWDGAAVILAKNRCEGNSRNGIHADNGLSSATIEANQLIANREFGLVLDSAGSGKISGNTVRGNLLGGVVIRTAGGRVICTGNQITGNQGPGLTLEAGLPPASYSGNTVTQNIGQQILASMDLSGKAAAPETATPAPAIEKIPRAKVIAEPPSALGR